VVFLALHVIQKILLSSLLLLIELENKTSLIKLVIEYESAGFDVGELSEDGPDDWEGLDASASHIAK
jgi:hypothetical protein